MSLYKSAQVQEAKDKIEDLGGEDQVILFEAEPHHEHHDMIEIDEEPHTMKFEIGLLPGCDSGPLEVSEDELEGHEDTKPAHKDLEVRDAWDYNSADDVNFMSWVQERLAAIPRHNGESLGLERAMAYLKRFNRELSNAVANDLEGKIDIAQLEAVR